MGRTLLFLVDREGRPLSPELRAAVDNAYYWASHDYPNLDPSLLATWAEQVGASMAEREATVRSPHRYASAAMQNKIREHYRSGGAREVTVGTSLKLEEGVGHDFQSAQTMERRVLFRELHSQLSQRDQRIFILLQQEVNSPSTIASSLGISYNAAAKAVQRVKERLHAILTRRPLSPMGEEQDEN